MWEYSAVSGEYPVAIVCPLKPGNFHGQQMMSMCLVMDDTLSTVRPVRLMLLAQKQRHRLTDWVEHALSTCCVHKKGQSSK
jgi:hypothetical protein